VVWYLQPHITTIGGVMILEALMFRMHRLIGLAVGVTSMASPHAAGVAALIVSQYGTLGSDGDVKLPPTTVESYMQSTTIDQGLTGYDECFGNGRITALRAVTHNTKSVYDATAPFCPEYTE